MKPNTAVAMIHGPVTPGPERAVPDDVFGRTGRHLRSLLSVRVPRPDQDPRGVAALCHAVLAVRSLGQLHLLQDSVRDGVSNALDRMQDPATGLFQFAYDRCQGASVETLRMTVLAVQTLEAFERRSLYPLTFARAWLEDGPDEAWLTGQGPANTTGMELLALALSSLLHVAERHCDREAHARVHTLLDRLQAEQDRHTGLWGGSALRLGERLVAASRFVPHFDRVNRPVQRVSRIADSMLAAWPDPDAPVPARAELQSAAAILLASRLRAGPAPRIRRQMSICLGEIASDLAPVAAGQNDVPGEDLLRLTWLRLQAAREIATVLLEDAPEDPGGRPASAPSTGPHPLAASSLPSFARPESPATDGIAVARFWIRDLPELDERLATPPSQPDVAVVIPCYNLGIYLHEALASVAGQTLTNLEIIVVDDGSTDGYTPTILEHWEGRGLRVIRQPNRGVAEARNRGVRETSAPYVCCLDPDDRISPDYLERALSILGAATEVGFVSGHTRMFDELELTLNPMRCALPGMYVCNGAIQPALFRKSAWDRVGGYWTGFSSSGIEDWDLWLRILEAGLRAEVIPEVVWEYRIRAGQMSDAMYAPDRWAALSSELAARHRNGFTANVDAIFAGQQAEWAKLRGWANEQRRGLEFWRSQADGWQAAAEERDTLIGELRAWIAELENAKSWWQDQAEQARRRTHD